MRVAVLRVAVHKSHEISEHQNYDWNGVGYKKRRQFRGSHAPVDSMSPRS